MRGPQMLCSWGAPRKQLPQQPPSLHMTLYPTGILTIALPCFFHDLSGLCHQQIYIPKGQGGQACNYLLLNSLVSTAQEPMSLRMVCI